LNLRVGQKETRHISRSHPVAASNVAWLVVTHMWCHCSTVWLVACFILIRLEQECKAAARWPDAVRDTTSCGPFNVSESKKVTYSLGPFQKYGNSRW